MLVLSMIFFLLVVSKAQAQHNVFVQDLFGNKLSMVCVDPISYSELSNVCLKKYEEHRKKTNPSFEINPTAKVIYNHMWINKAYGNMQLRIAADTTVHIVNPNNYKSSSSLTPFELQWYAKIKWKSWLVAACACLAVYWWSKQTSCFRGLLTK